MTAFDTVDFCPSRFFCGSFKTKAVSCDNVQTTFGKTFRSKCDLNFFEITLSPHSCLLGNYSFIFGGCSWYSFAVMMIFILCIDLFQQINLRSSLPGYFLEKKYSRYIGGSPRKTKDLLTELNIFYANIWKFCHLHVPNSFVQQRFSP